MRFSPLPALRRLRLAARQRLCYHRRLGIDGEELPSGIGSGFLLIRLRCDKCHRVWLVLKKISARPAPRGSGRGEALSVRRSDKR